MQAFERSERRDRHQASIHSQKRKCQSPQCMATIKRCWIWNSHLICYTGNIYPSTSSLSTRDVSSALQPLSPSAPIAARCGLATASQVVNLESCIWQQLRLGGYFLFSCHKFCMMLFYHIFFKLVYFQHHHCWPDWNEPCQPMGLLLPLRSKSPCSILKL